MLVACFPALAMAQGQASGPILTLDDAIQLALKNNTTFLQSKSAEGRASAALRTAYGSLLPSLSSNFGVSFRKGGTQLFAGQALGASSDVIGSNYGLNLNAQYNLGSFLGPKQSKADLNAAEAGVSSSEQATRAAVAQQYLNVLQAQARAALQDTLILNAQAQLELAQARQQVGATTMLDVRNAEVAVSQAQVNQLRERNSVEVEMLRLFQTIGVEEPEGARLVTSFPVTEPSLKLDELLSMARSGNPDIIAAQERESAAGVGVAVARSRWLPTLSFNTSISGYTQQNTDIQPSIARAQNSAISSKASCLSQDSLRVGAGLSSISAVCDNITFTAADEAAIRAANEQFPFSFTKQPFSYSFGLSLPIFNNFQREQAIQEAQIQRNDARYRVRAGTAAHDRRDVGVPQPGDRLSDGAAADSQSSTRGRRRRSRAGALPGGRQHVRGRHAGPGQLRAGEHGPHQCHLRFSQGLRRARGRGRAAPALTQEPDR